MGFKEAAILTPVSFFLGVLFICFNIDHRLLWGEITEEVVEDGLQFYATFFNAPPAIKALLHGMVGIGLIGFLAKLHKWTESAVFFDGSSLAAYVFAIVVYLTVNINSLRTIVDPVQNVESREDQVMAMRVLAAGNVIIIASLGLILLLQAGQEWAQRTEAQAIADYEAEQRKKAMATTAEKKEQ
ncbi:hypothetical protein JR316_0008215 [Psilocybe cubensis]|uniref:Uncharacterized protein n=2 Tax=Psilocybe cubensis TaxID=181762 RepID=A0ACB8GV76_PSICU|nr:hypothetical protein JR316_0008215 [Psilocybe cubensis]KAH9479620.1 hypothetical protein JR316_0008215 [Psilocybe cubensis]